MPDGTLLFDLAETRPARPQPLVAATAAGIAEIPAAVADLVMLAQIRAQLCDDLGGIRQKLNRVDGGVARHVEAVAELAGLFERLVVPVAAWSAAPVSAKRRSHRGQTEDIRCNEHRRMERKPNLWLKPVETSSDLISSQMLFEERCWSDTYYTKTNLFVRDIPIVRDC